MAISIRRVHPSFVGEVSGVDITSPPSREHVAAIEGWPIPEAHAFIRDLTEHATQRQFIYAHEWRVNDLMMWDNRTVVHRVRRFRDLEEKRDLRRALLKGVGLEVAPMPREAA